MRIGCNNVKIKYLLLQRLRNVVTQIFVVTMNEICCNWQIFGQDKFFINLGGGYKLCIETFCEHFIKNYLFFLDAAASPSSGWVGGWVSGWVIVPDFPSLSAVVAGVWTQVDPFGPMWTKVDPCGPMLTHVDQNQSLKRDTLKICKLFLQTTNA